jgi:hypothetical protein
MHRDLEAAQEILRVLQESGLNFVHRKAALEAALAVHQADGEIIGGDLNDDRQ